MKTLKNQANKKEWKIFSQNILLLVFRIVHRKQLKCTHYKEGRNEVNVLKKSTHTHTI